MSRLQRCTVRTNLLSMKLWRRKKKFVDSIHRVCYYLRFQASTLRIRRTIIVFFLFCHYVWGPIPNQVGTMRSRITYCFFRCAELLVFAKCCSGFQPLERAQLSIKKMNLKWSDRSTTLARATELCRIRYRIFTTFLEVTGVEWNLKEDRSYATDNSGCLRKKRVEMYH